MKYYVFGCYTSIDGDSIACGSGSCFVFSDTFGGLTAGAGVDFGLGDSWILGGQYSKGFGDLDECNGAVVNGTYK